MSRGLSKQTLAAGSASLVDYLPSEGAAAALKQDDAAMYALFALAQQIEATL
jgi:hypothetical protein